MNTKTISALFISLTITTSTFAAGSPQASKPQDLESLSYVAAGSSGAAVVAGAAAHVTSQDVLAARAAYLRLAEAGITLSNSAGATETAIISARILGLQTLAVSAAGFAGYKAGSVMVALDEKYNHGKMIDKISREGEGIVKGTMTSLENMKGLLSDSGYRQFVKDSLTQKLRAAGAEIPEAYLRLLPGMRETLLDKELPRSGASQ